MKERFYSLDIFRGATVALMILVNNPGSWSHIYAPLAHAPWHGSTPTDLVFPFFLFAVGNAMAFVMPRLQTESLFWKKVLKRSLLIFLIGLLLNWFPFIKYDDAGNFVAKNLGKLRIMGVLQRIAVCYFFAAIIIHYCKVKGTFVLASILLLIYWFVCLAGNPSDPFSLTGWFGTDVDIAILGEAHLYRGEGIAFDPEGIASSLGAIAQVCFGYLIGWYIISKGKTAEMLNVLFVTAGVFLALGYVWDMVFPINKKIWTSSYVIYTTGLATFILSIMIYLVEFKNRKGWLSRFFDVFGKNALFIFAMSGALVRLQSLIRIPREGKGYDAPLSWFYNQVCAAILPSDPRLGSFIYALCFITLMYLMAWYLDRRKIYIKV